MISSPNLAPLEIHYRDGRAVKVLTRVFTKASGLATTTLELLANGKYRETYEDGKRPEYSGEKELTREQVETDYDRSSRGLRYLEILGHQREQVEKNLARRKCSAEQRDLTKPLIISRS